MTGVGRIVVALALLAGLWPGSVAAQATQAGVVTTLEGNVTAARATAAQPIALKFKDDVFINDRVVTGDRSLARLLLGGKAVVTIRERSALTITEVPARSTIDLDSGKIAVAVAKDKMRPGEQIEVKTPNAVAAVRGTVFIAEVVRATASADNAQGGTTANFYVLAGLVEVSTGTQIVTVGPNNFASVTGGIVNSGVMSALMRANATSGLATKGLPKVSGADDDAKQTAMNTTVATFTDASLPIVTPPITPQPTIIGAVQYPPLLPGGTGSDISLDTIKRVQPNNVTPPVSPVTGSGMLLLGDADIFPVVPSRAALASDLRALQPNALVTNLNGWTLPADLSAYGTIWYVGAFRAISTSDQARLAQFLAGGGGVYLTGERPCCAALNGSVQSLLRLVVNGGSGITLPNMNDFGFPRAVFNATARGGVTTTPNALTSWFPAGPGEIVGVAGPNVLATVGPAIVGGVWDKADLVGNAGRVVLMMDVDWLSNADSLANCSAQCRRNIIQNFVTFFDHPAGPIVLTHPLFRSSGEMLATLDSFFDLPGMSITSTSLAPLFWLSGSTLRTQGVFSRITGSTVTTAGSFLRLDSGAQIVQAGTDPLVSMSGGILVSAGGHLFDLTGRAGVTQNDVDTGLTVGADRPIQPGSAAPVFDADNGAAIAAAGSAYRVDTALLEATAPLLNLKGGSVLVTGDHAVNLVGSAKVSILNDAIAMIALRSSALTVANGHLVNVAGGSVLNIAGNLVALSDSSTLSILSGLLLNVSGGSSALIGRSLVSFSGSGNVLNVNNSIAPTAIINGIPVSGPADSFRIGANAIAGAGAGTIRINGVALTPNTPLSSLTGSLVAVQGGGTVKVGR